MTEGEELPSGFPAGWYVCFHGTGKRGWWDVFTRPGYRHVLAFAYAAHAERWLIYDVTQHRTLIRALTTDVFLHWVANLPTGRKIVLFEADGVEAEPAWRVGFWCTTAVAHLVGARSRALRPEALYRDLLAQGARPAFQEPSRAVETEAAG